MSSSAEWLVIGKVDMLDRLAYAMEAARAYFETTEELVRLGWGISGVVFLSPDSSTAVKVHDAEDAWLRKVAVYRRLESFRLTNVHGFNIPRMRGQDANHRVIAMDCVRAPYLLDFAGASLVPPDFPEDVMKDVWSRVDETYGPNAWLAHLVYAKLADHGIYYTDFRKSNLCMDGHPDCVADLSEQDG